MTVARIIPKRIRDQQDANLTLGAGTNGYAVIYSHTTGLFELAALEAVGVAAGLITAHVGLSNPHTQYTLASSFTTHQALTTAHGISAYGATLVDDADATTARGTLGLGTMATQDSTAYLLASGYTAADVLSKLLTVDGSGSGLDADLLDGLSSAAFEAVGVAATHAALTAAHGATGAVVGTTNTQTLTGKTIAGGAAATESANLVVNGTFDTDTSWTKGTNWTIAAGVATKTAGSAADLTQNLGEAAGKMYSVRFGYTRTAGTLSVSIGGVTHATTFSAASGSGDLYMLAISTADLSFIADATFAGTIDNVIVGEIVATTTVMSLSNAAGTVVRPVRLATGSIGIDGGGTFNTTGNYWNALGQQAGYSNTTGGYWNAFGYQAGYFNTTGGYWNALGQQAGYSNTTGTYWNAFGREAGYSNTTGSQWNAFGLQAGYFNTTGGFWNAFGYQAGYFNTTGGYWNAFGREAGYSNTTGSQWNAFGRQAGYFNTTGSFWNAFGYRALYLATGSGNQGFGFQAGDNITTGQYNLVLGYDLDAPSATADYQLAIGGYIVGDGSRIWLEPRTDSTTGVQFRAANGTTVLFNVDTTSGLTTLTGTSTATHAAFQMMSSTTPGRDAGRLAWDWPTPTDAVRASRGKLTAYFTSTEQEAIRWTGDTGGILLGFYGQAGAARQLLATGAARTVDDVITFLQNLGLAKQS